MVFPLIDLPAVAFTQVLRGFASSDLFEMHQCSPQTGAVLRIFEKQVKAIKVNIDFQRKWVDVKGVRRYHATTAEEKKGVVPSTTRKFYTTEVPTEVTDDEKTFTTYWNNEEEKNDGLLMIVNDLIQSTGLGQLENILFDKSVSVPKVLDWIAQAKLTLENFNLIETIEGQEDAVADLIYSEEFFRKVSLNYVSLLQVSPEYKPKNLEFIKKCITVFQLFLHHSHWFTYDHLLGFNTGSIVLYHSKMSSGDLNKYLKLWVQENYTRLAYLSINLEEGHKFDIKVITDGIVDPKNILIEADNREVVILNRPDKIGELSLNAKKNELVFFVEDVEKKAAPSS